MRGFVVAAILGVGLGAPAMAQQSLDVLCDPASSAFDAVTAAPQQHKVVFEDAHVRVLQINLSPMQAEPPHIHALPSVIEGTRDPKTKFAYVTYRYDGSKFVETGRNEVTPSPGYAATYAGPEGPHAIVNLSPVPVRFTRIEIKPEACSR